MQDLQNDLVKMRQASAQVMASTKQLEKRAEQAETQSQVRPIWEGKQLLLELTPED